MRFKITDPPVPPTPQTTTISLEGSTKRFVGVDLLSLLSSHWYLSRSTFPQDMDIFKPDHAAYNKQREAASSAVALVASSSGTTNPDAAALAAAQDLYRDANSFVYADHKPSEDAIDRVIGKINLEYVHGDFGSLDSLVSTDPYSCNLSNSLDKRQKRSRERKNEDEGDITYINEKVSSISSKWNLRPNLAELHFSRVPPLLTLATTHTHTEQAFQQKGEPITTKPQTRPRR